MLTNKIGLLVCQMVFGIAFLACQGRPIARAPEPGATTSLAVAAAVGGKVRVKILEEQGGRVSWLGTKNLIAFDSGGYEGRTEVYSVRLDGSDKRCLTCAPITEREPGMASLG
jgi:hypothetical protein